MKVLLLAGTGVMGSYLAQEYNKKGIETYITSRLKRESYGTVRYLVGNAMNLDFLRQVCSQTHWDAIVDFLSYNTEQFRERYNILLNATNQYVFISTGRVYGHEEYPIKETSPRLLDCSTDLEFLKTDEYSLTKARQENILIESGHKNYTIIRPCIIYGDERLQLGVLEKEEWLYRALHGRYVVFCKEILERTTTMTNGLDVARAFINIIGNPKCKGETYHITCSHHRTWRQIYEIYKSSIKEITGIDVKMKIVSLEDFIKSRPAYLKYQVVYDRVFDKMFDVTKVSSIIDVSSFVAPEEGLKECLSNFIKQEKKFKYIPIKFEARRDKLTKSCSTLFDIPEWKQKIRYVIYRFIK